MRRLIAVLWIAALLSVTACVVGRSRTEPPSGLGSSAPPVLQDAAAAPDRTTAGPSSMPADPDARLRAFFATPLAKAVAKETAMYDRQGLFSYIDGAAPTYLEHHFRRLAAAALSTASGDEFIVDVYDMSNAENAKAIFALERSPGARPVAGWPEAVEGPLSLVFHHDRYYVKLTAYDARAQVTLREIARALWERMQA